jgi:heptosyltransferase-2
MKTLVVAPQWIGDAVMSEPLIRNLVTQGDRVVVVALAHTAHIYQLIDGVAEVIVWPFRRGAVEIFKRWKIARSIRGQFDKAIICTNSFKSALIPWFAKIPHRVGYIGESRGWLLTQTIENPKRRDRRPMVSYYKLLAGLGGTQGESKRDDGQESPVLIRNADLVRKTREKFSVPLGRYTVLAPGAEYGEAKRWPTKYYAQLCKNLLSIGQSVLILGSVADAGVASEIEQYCSNQGLGAEQNEQQDSGVLKNLCAKTSLLEAAWLISDAAALVSNDSGLMHIGAAYEVPQVAIFGSSSPLHTPPLNKKAQIMWLALECAPCFKRQCPLGHLNCLKGIDVSRVQTALELALKGGQARVNKTDV